MIYGNTRFTLMIKPKFGPWLSAFVPALLVLLVSTEARAQQWKDALKDEKAKNGVRMDAINKKGAPIAAELRQNTAAIDRHNAEHPDGVCTYPEGHPEVCEPWIKESKVLNTEHDRLRSLLQPLVDEFDRLESRNREIDRQLRCVAVPLACKSDSDCNQPCSSCGTFDGREKSGRCQPRP